MDKVAIVILNWNGAKMMHQYLPTVLNYSCDEATVYVADNASTDNSMELLRSEFPEVKTIVLDKNWGFAEGYNKALQQIKAEYYLLLNSDIEVTHHWLTPMIEFMDVHPEVARMPSNMPGRVGDIWTVMAILSVAVVSSTRWRMTTGSMTMQRRFSGQQVLR